jgi:hypothetical protein
MPQVYGRIEAPNKGKIDLLPRYPTKPKNLEELEERAQLI